MLTYRRIKYIWLSTVLWFEKISVWILQYTFDLIEDIIHILLNITYGTCITITVNHMNKNVKNNRIMQEKNI